MIRDYKIYVKKRGMVIKEIAVIFMDISSGIFGVNECIICI